MSEKVKNLKRTQVKCHGRFKTSLKVKDDKVEINFIADRKTVDLNKLGGMLKDGATAIFVSDQTSLPTNEEEPKEAKGQISLLDGGKQEKVN